MANAILSLNFKERRNDNGKNDERIKGWVGSGVNQFNGFSGIRKVHQLERSWTDALDLHHYRSDYRSSAVDPGGGVVPAARAAELGPEPRSKVTKV